MIYMRHYDVILFFAPCDDLAAVNRAQIRWPLVRFETFSDRLVSALKL